NFGGVNHENPHGDGCSFQGFHYRGHIFHAGVSGAEPAVPGADGQTCADPGEILSCVVAGSFTPRRKPGRAHWNLHRTLRIEIPVGAAWFPAWGEGASNNTRKNLARVGARLPIRAGHRWLRPTHSSVEDMTAVMKSLKAAAVPVWVFMIHSSEIAPCQLLPTEDEVRKLVEIGRA